jgi:hypothetical protein
METGASRFQQSDDVEIPLVKLLTVNANATPAKR